MMPHGFRFNPTDEEIIQILERKVSDEEMPLPFILHTNVYEREPQLLTQWNEATAAVNKEERYYYCKRENDSREVPGKGWWRATSHVKKIYISGNLVGHKRPLTFYRFKHYDNKDRTDAVKTNWLMHEYCLDSVSTEWRVCKIKHKGKPSIQEEMESIKQSLSLMMEFEDLSHDQAQSSVVNCPPTPLIVPIATDNNVNVPTEPSFNGLHSHGQYWEHEGTNFDHYFHGGPSFDSDHC